MDLNLDFTPINEAPLPVAETNLDPESTSDAEATLKPVQTPKTPAKRKKDAQAGTPSKKAKKADSTPNKTVSLNQIWVYSIRSNTHFINSKSTSCLLSVMYLFL